MKNVKRFEDLNVWKEGMKLARDIYQILASSKDFGLRNQMQHAAVSIPSNIAEGFERHTNKEFIQYLYIAKGSCAELRTQIYLAIDLRQVEKEIGNTLLDRSLKISSMLYRLIQVRASKFK